MKEQISIENFFVDKSTWKKVRFGDVVFEPKESSKNPVAEGIEHVVGLEHIDTDDIHLRRSESIGESTTFTKRFSIGDVLFGRRRVTVHFKASFPCLRETGSVDFSITQEINDARNNHHRQASSQPFRLGTVDGAVRSQRPQAACVL